MPSSGWDNADKQFKKIKDRGERKGKMYQNPESQKFSEPNWNHVPTAVKMVEELGGTLTAAIYLFGEEQEKKNGAGIMNG